MKNLIRLSKLEVMNTLNNLLNLIDPSIEENLKNRKYKVNNL